MWHIATVTFIVWLVYAFTARPPVRHVDKVMAVAKCVSDTMEAMWLPCWLDCGSLLGSRRNGKIIPWDTPMDVDMAMFASDTDFMRMPAVAARLARCGVVMIHRDDFANRVLRALSFGMGHWVIQRSAFRAYMHTRFSTAYVDIGDFAPAHEDVLGRGYVSFLSQKDYHGDRPYWHINSIMPLAPCKLEGVPMLCPADTNSYLAQPYGKDFMEPRAGVKEWDIPHPVAPDLAYHGTPLRPADEEYLTAVQ